MTRITVACVQLEARDLGQAEEALARALAAVEEAGRGGADVIVLPECTYPAYYIGSLEAYRRSEPRPVEEVLRRFGERARRHGAWIALGLARPAPSGHLRNSLALLGPDGEVHGLYDKIFLWHFDREWFEPGSALPVFDLPFGRVGLMICADARMPEIPRALARQGAQLLLDATALVTSVGAPEARTNPQVLYMLPTRAMENGVWIAVANKVGMEAQSILYCGRSGVIRPDGQWAAQAHPDREALVMAEVDLAAAPGPRVLPPTSDPLLTAPLQDLPIVERLREPIPPEALYGRIGLLQLQPQETARDWIHRVATLGETLIRQGASLLIVSGGAPADQARDPLAALSARWGCALAALLREDEAEAAVYLWEAGRLLGIHRKGSASELPVYATSQGALGVLLDEEGWAPEIARGLMLRGAELLLWWVPRAAPVLHTAARTRADENRVFVALIAPPGAADGPASAVFDPLGNALATGVPGAEHGILASLFRPLVRHKEMAPGSHVVFSRSPTAFCVGNPPSPPGAR